MAEVIPTKKSAKVIDTWKTKKWFTVNSPALFGNRPIGETIAAEDSLVVGRTLKTSLAAVTGDVKRQNINIIFEITDLNQGVAQTKIKKIEVAPSSIRRLIRKGKERIDLSMICATKDNVVVRIKPFLVTRGKVGGSVLTKMRNLLDAALRVEAHKSNYENLIRDVVSGNLQRKVKMRLNKLYPVKTSEIRSIEATVFEGKLPPVPELEEIKEESAELTEEEKMERKVRAQKQEQLDIIEEKAEKKSKKKAEV